MARVARERRRTARRRSPTRCSPSACCRSSSRVGGEPSRAGGRLVAVGRARRRAQPGTRHRGESRHERGARRRAAPARSRRVHARPPRLGGRPACRALLREGAARARTARDRRVGALADAPAAARRRCGRAGGCSGGSILRIHLGAFPFGQGSDTPRRSLYRLVEGLLDAASQSWNGGIDTAQLGEAAVPLIIVVASRDPRRRRLRAAPAHRRRSGVPRRRAALRLHRLEGRPVSEGSHPGARDRADAAPVRPGYSEGGVIVRA